MYIGELISLFVAFSWTITALVAEVASKRMGSIVFNVVRMLMSIAFLVLTLWLFFGVPYPLYADGNTWLWLCLSGFVGYVLGDYCLFQSYILIGSRFGQLLMTLAPPSAAITAWILLGEKMTWLAVVGMIVTISGIALSVLGKNTDQEESELANNKKSVGLKFPVRGLLFGIGAGVGQGIGLVLSKVGMQYYESSIIAHGCTLDMIPSGSFLDLVPFSFAMPFASTLIRAVMGLLGFVVALFLFTHNGQKRFVAALHDKRALTFAMLATIFGPFIGVSLSLMATLYTNAGIAQTIMALTPVFIIWPSVVFFKQKVTMREIVGAVISVGGVCLFFV